MCWVCGELVVRGDECVSLGWCFWHRACYGCLVCGCRILVRGVGVGDVFYDQGAGEGGGGVGDVGLGIGVGDGVGGYREDLGRGKGREVEEVPLCGRCVLEVDGEEFGRGRWEGGGGWRGVAGTDGVEEEGEWEGAEWMDGEGRYTGEKGMFYVSMSDPMGQPGFKPRRMKPIPVWMHPFRRRDGGGVDRRQGDVGLSATWPEKSTSFEPRESRIPGVDGAGSTADSDTSLEHPSAMVEPLRLPRSRPAKLVTADENGSLSSLGTYHAPPKSPELPIEKRRPNAALDVKSGERRATVGRRTEPQSTNPIKHNTSKDHLNLPRKPSKTNQHSAQSSSFLGPRVSKSATPLTSSTSRQRNQLTKKPSRRPSIPTRRSNHKTKTSALGLHNHDATSKREDNPRVDAEFLGRRDSSAVEQASAAEVGRRGGSVVERTSVSEARRMRSNVAAGERTPAGERSAARDQTAVVHGLMQDVEVRQVKKPRSMQTELRRLFGF